MHLFLLQHGEALVESVDPRRPLSEQGRSDVERLTAFVARSGVRVQRVCESGKLRARQTAEIAAARIGSGVAIETMTGLNPNDPVEPWVDVVNGWTAEVLLVGHLPFLGRLAVRLLAPNASVFLAFTAGSLACLEREQAADACVDAAAGSRPVAAATVRRNSRRSRMELSTVRIDKPAETNFILGQSHFIKTVEDLHEAIVQTVPQMKFGIAFCESSGPALVRWTGNDAELIDLAKRNASALACGHCFIIFLSGGFPINVLNTIKAVPEVCGIYCATANPAEVIVAETEGGRGVLGVIDGMKSKGIEAESDIEARKQLLRKFGYKL